MPTEVKQTEAQRLAEVFQRIDSPSVLVVGDVCTDRWIALANRRDNPESDAPCWQTAGEVAPTLGMAGNVAEHLTGLGANVRRLSPPMHVVKTRLVDADGRQVLRYDCDRTATLSDALGTLRLAEMSVRRWGPETVALVDYGKGALPDGDDLRTLIAAARERNIHVLVDPARGADWQKYAGATVIKPNVVEYRESYIALDPDPLLFITRGGFGADLVSHPLDTGQWFPATSRTSIDPCGAGDAVMAMLAYCLAGGVQIEDACKLSMHAGGLAVERLGTKPFTRDELIADILQGETQ